MAFAPAAPLLGIYHREIIGQACKHVRSRVFLADGTYIESSHERSRCSIFIEMERGLQRVGKAFYTGYLVYKFDLYKICVKFCARAQKYLEGCS